MITVELHGADPEDIRAESHPDNDDAVSIGNDIHQLLQEDYGYLGVDGVSIVADTPIEDVPDFPE